MPKLFFDARAEGAEIRPFSGTDALAVSLEKNFSLKVVSSQGSFDVTNKATLEIGVGAPNREDSVLRPPVPAGQMSAIGFALKRNLARFDRKVAGPEAPQFDWILVSVILNRIGNRTCRHANDPILSQFQNLRI